MPLWLRRFTYNKLTEFYDKKNAPPDTVEQSIKTLKAAGATNSTKVNVPSYVTKASKK
jgi:hypothetical protein